MNFKKVLLIDALSTIHVGNGVLVDNTYKLCKSYIADEVEVISADIKPNIGRFPVLIEDIFSNYAGTAFKKIKFSMGLLFFYIVEIANAKLFNSKIRFPWGGSFRDLIDAIERSDICVSLSGETINDHYYPQMYQRLLTYHLAIVKGKQFILFPQSIGPIFKPLSKILLRLFLGKARIVIARDQRSFDVAKSLWVDKKVEVLYCPDVAVTQVSEPLSLPGVVNGKKVIGLTVSEIPKDEMGFNGDYLTILVEKLTSYFDSDDYQFLLMPSNYTHEGMSGDYRVSVDAQNRLNNKGFDAAILPNDIIHPETYQGMQKNLFMFISTRMHVGILATSAGIPTIMVNTQHKILAYMKVIEMERFVIELNEMEQLESKLNLLVDSAADIKNTLLKKNRILCDEVIKTVSSLI